ncbi:MAG: hypothetical protein GF418_16440 [Chitinivibrionales bacterium]|nr:hypothetical protein [Chitinivibrionales bacterium]MBD3397211.1 hypothetical protein [Chitinivibrionales bacterium]
MEPLAISGRKNDALFVRLSTQPLPAVHVYCQSDIEVVHGPSCREPGREIDTARCAAGNVPVRLRRGGGGTVVLSPGMVIIAAVGARHTGDTVHTVFSRIHRAIIGLVHETAGIELEEKGISDLAVDNRKVLGSSLYLSNRPPLYCYQASLMVDSDLSLLSRFLRHPPREPGYREGRSHDMFCSTLTKCGCRLSCDEVADLLGKHVRNRLWKMTTIPRG